MGCVGSAPAATLLRDWSAGAGAMRSITEAVGTWRSHPAPMDRWHDWDVPPPPPGETSPQGESVHQSATRPVFPPATTWKKQCVTTGDLSAANPGCATPASLWAIRTADDFEALGSPALPDTIELQFDLGERTDCDDIWPGDFEGSDVRWNCIFGGAEGERMLRTTWALLRANLDLLELAMCWVIRSQEQTSSDLEHQLAQRLACARDVIRGRKRLKLRMYREPTPPHWWDPQPPCPINVVASRPVGTDRINICTGSTTSSATEWKNCVTIWSGGSTAQRACASIELARILAHEMMHMCSVVNDSDSVAGNCASTNLVESLLRWQLLRRYPVAMDATCCRAAWGVPVAGLGTNELNPGIIGANMGFLPDIIPRANGTCAGAVPSPIYTEVEVRWPR